MSNIKKYFDDIKYKRAGARKVTTTITISLQGDKLLRELQGSLAKDFHIEQNVSLLVETLVNLVHVNYHTFFDNLENMGVEK